jgi:spermidine synthase
VTSVFIRWDGYDDDEHESLLSLQKFFYACQEIISDSGGFLRQFLVDDKGISNIYMYICKYVKSVFFLHLYIYIYRGDLLWYCWK